MDLTTCSFVRDGSIPFHTVERIVILGPGGAGKTTLAIALAELTRVPIVHLDHLFWRPGWKPAPPDEAQHALLEVVARDRWILDGNFLGDDAAYAEPRFDRADTVIFLDLPRSTCLWRVARRLARDHGRARADLPEGCREQFDLGFLKSIWSYPRTTRPRVLQLLDHLSEDVDVHHLHSDTDIKAFLTNIERRAARED